MGIKKKRGNSYPPCERCGKRKKTVEETYDPYFEEIENRKVRAFLCDECYQKCLWDI